MAALCFRAVGRRGWQLGRLGAKRGAFFVFCGGGIGRLLRRVINGAYVLYILGLWRGCVGLNIP